MRLGGFPDNEPFAGWTVNFSVTGGPDAVFSPGDAKTASVKTDASGVAKVTLKQVKAMEGENTIAMEIIRPATAEEAAMKIASGSATKKWIGPEIAIEKTAPARAGIGDAFKYAITIDLSKALGVEVFKRLVTISDVVVENFTPRVMANYGLDYKVLSEVNPSIIMISISGYGRQI